MSHDPHSPRAGQAGFEATDAQPRPLLLFGAGLTALIVVAFVASAWLASAFESARPESFSRTHPMEEHREQPRGPLLQAVPNTEIMAHRAAVDRQLNTYGPADGVDETDRRAHIPIEEAMRHVAQHGLPDLVEGR